MGLYEFIFVDKSKNKASEVRDKFFIILISMQNDKKEIDMESAQLNDYPFVDRVHF